MNLVLILWLSQASVRQRGSISSRLTLLQRAESQNTTTGTSRLRSNSNLSSGDADSDKVYPHPVSPRASTPILPPVLVRLFFRSSLPLARPLVLRQASNGNLSEVKTDNQQSKTIDTDPLHWIEFTEDSIITSCKSGKSLSRLKCHIRGAVLVTHRGWDRAYKNLEQTFGRLANCE